MYTSTMQSGGYARFLEWRDVAHRVEEGCSTGSTPRLEEDRGRVVVKRRDARAPASSSYGRALISIDQERRAQIVAACVKCTNVLARALYSLRYLPPS